MPSTAQLPKERVRIAIDRGGTFTDVLGISESKGNILIKLLSVDPKNYPDAPTEGIRRVLEWYTGEVIPRGVELDTAAIQWIRMGTTVATNALLERKGEQHAMLITKGFKDLITIGNQTRPRLFELAIKKPDVLYKKVVEVDERVVVQWPELSQVEGESLVTGLSGEMVRILEPLNEASVTHSLQELYAEGYRAIGICFAHSYTFPDHERRVAAIAREMGFEHVSVSSELQQMIRFVSRANSTSADAYLTPEVRRYLSGFAKGFKGHLEDGACEVSFMKSDGSLVDYRKFSGLNAILSGPAGGVVGFAGTSYVEDKRPLVGFDMGGTSTDVSRYGGAFEHVLETETAGVTIQAPQLDINTVAAGGGSILHYANNMFVVGPDSASSHPGPASYRKGGPLTVTDANLFLGRINVDAFPKIFGPNEDQSLDFEIVKEKFEGLTKEINEQSGSSYTPFEAAQGFLSVANEAMAKPIRQLTEAKGFLTTEHNLASFGGAGGQHACAIASLLGIHSVIVHKYSSVLSAFGMALADTAVDKLEPSALVYSPAVLPKILERLDALKATGLEDLITQNVSATSIVYEEYLNLRYRGSDTALMVPAPSDGNFEQGFLDAHKREFGFLLADTTDILVDDIRVRAIGQGARGGAVETRSYLKDLDSIPKSSVKRSTAFAAQQTYFEESAGHVETPIYRLSDLKHGNVITGPAILLDATQTIVLPPPASATILPDHVWIDVGLGPRKALSTEKVDPIALSVFGSRFMSIAERMGRTLQRTACSLQIKERLDFSCAVFGPDAGLVANAPHIPVHLGSMSKAISFAAEEFAGRLKEGDILVSNHSACGGSHLPDITVIMPVFEKGEIVFYVAARGHHTDIGGLNGNSMPPDSVSIEQEGAQIPPMLLVTDGKFREEEITEVFMRAGEYDDCLASRRIQDNIADLQAQCAACRQGASQIQDLFREYGKEVVQFYMRAIRNNAEFAVREFLIETYDRFEGRPLHALDFMDDGTPIEMTMTIDRATGGAKVDFTGTGREGNCNYNAPIAVANSALIYCLRTLIGKEMPLNAGVLAPIDLFLPEGSLLNPSPYAAVSSGNTETSQRVVDVILRAFEVTAASQGCMNVFHANYRDMTYGETICGGAGAGPGWHGQSGVHVNMTNTRITDPEVLEKRFPLILRQFTIREGSGGNGKFKGGNGVHREFECLMPGTHMMVIGERRVNAPYGLHGGDDGERGCSYWNKMFPDGVRRTIKLKPSGTVHPQPGDRLIIHTPGGGGYGAIDDKDEVVAAKTNGFKVNVNSKPQFSRANGSVAAYQQAVESQ